MMKIKSSFQAATWTGSVELTKKRATARTMHQRGLPAVFWPNWHAANLNTKQSITNPLRSLSTPVAIRGRAAVHHSINPQHLVGLPRPLDVMIGHLIGRSSPQHPAHSDKWWASEISMEK